MGLTDLQKLDLKFTTRTALLLKTCSEITDALQSSSRTTAVQGDLNEAMAASLLEIKQRLDEIETKLFHVEH